MRVRVTGSRLYMNVPVTAVVVELRSYLLSLLKRPCHYHRVFSLHFQLRIDR